MKKKILAVFMAIATTLCCAVGLAACGGDNGGKGGEGGTGSGSGGEEIDIQPPHAPSEGLEYEWAEEYLPYYTAGYVVSGMGTCTDTDLVIPSTHDGLPVVAVGNSGNYYAEETAYPDITSVYIPDSVQCIMGNAFVYCKSLKSATIGKNAVIKTYYWNYNVFAGCPLEYITVAKGNKNYHSKNNCVIETESKALIIGTANSIIPDDGSVTSIGGGAFFGCSSLTGITIPNSVTKIGSYAFFGCSSLTGITIPNSVTEIEDMAFSGCTSLTSIIVDSGNTKYHSAGNCIIETASKTLIAGCKNSIIPTDGSVTSIGDYAFNSCTSLESITIPDSVISIGYQAFYGCTSLESITIPNSVTSIGHSAFYGCTALTSITIPDSVTSIGNSAFSGCSSLTSITIPDSVTSIDYAAFRYCTSLSLIDFKGTKAQWYAIGKDHYWNDDTGNYTVQCTDGKLDKEGNEVS